MPTVGELRKSTRNEAASQPNQERKWHLHSTLTTATFAALTPGDFGPPSGWMIGTTLIILLVLAICLRWLVTWPSIDEDEDSSDESSAQVDEVATAGYGADLTPDAVTFLQIWDLAALVAPADEEDPFTKIDVHALDPALDEEQILSIFPDHVPDHGDVLNDD